MVNTPQRRLGLIYVLVGPPGVGKNALMNRVLARTDNLKQLPTATTRPIRPTEQQGREHLFLSRPEFQQLIDTNALIEWQVVHGELYGMPRQTVENAINAEQDLIADIDVLGATYLRSLYPDNAVLIFIQPPNLDELKRRMETRGETEEEIAKRLRRVDMEMQYAPLCDYLITNSDLEEASDLLYGIVLAERSRRALLNLRVERDLPRHRLTYMATVIPLFGSEVLCRDTEPRFPMAQITHGEFPHDAAIRALRRDLGLDATSQDLMETTGSTALILPVALETSPQENFDTLDFVYLYFPRERFQPPEHWQWTSLQHVELSPSVLAILEDGQTMSTQHP